MARDVRTIDAAFWQPQVGVLGEIVEDIDDINQCILTILLTPKRSDPLRPDFALNIWAYVDKPINVIRAPLVRDVIEAIQKYERRAKIIKTEITPAEDYAGFTLSVTWVPSGSDNSDTPTTTSVLIPTSSTIVTSPFVSIPFRSTTPPVLSEVDGGVL